MSMSRKLIFIAAIVASIAAVPVVVAEEAMEPEQLANIRVRVETAAHLAAIAETEKDGQMMIMAAKLMSTVGKVARPGKTTADGKPEFFDLKAMLSTANGFGADTGKAAESIAMSKPLPAMDYCAIGYWRESCDYNGYCRWEYVC